MSTIVQAISRYLTHIYIDLTRRVGRYPDLISRAVRLIVIGKVFHIAGAAKIIVIAKIYRDYRWSGAPRRYRDIAAPTQIIFTLDAFGQVFDDRPTRLDNSPTAVPISSLSATRRVGVRRHRDNFDIATHDNVLYCVRRGNDYNPTNFTHYSHKSNSICHGQKPSRHGDKKQVSRLKQPYVVRFFQFLRLNRGA